MSIGWGLPNSLRRWEAPYLVLGRGGFCANTFSGTSLHSFIYKANTFSDEDTDGFHAIARLFLLLFTPGLMTALINGPRKLERLVWGGEWWPYTCAHPIRLLLLVLQTIITIGEFYAGQTSAIRKLSYTDFTGIHKFKTIIDVSNKHGKIIMRDVT